MQSHPLLHFQRAFRLIDTALNDKERMFIMKCYVCIDIGGTNIKYGLANEQGTLLERGERPTLAQEEGAAGIVSKVIDIAGNYGKTHNPEGIAIATAGIVNAKDGSIAFAGEKSFPGYTGTKLRSLVEDALGIPCAVENDVNSAGLGEYWLGAGRNASSIFMMAVGTGIGGCLLLDGKVFHGAGGSAGEIGFMRFPGQDVIFEEIASTRALVERTAAACSMNPAELTGEKVFQMASDGNLEAISAVEVMAENLGDGIAQICCLLNPDVILLGGAVMKQEAVLGPLIKKHIEAHVLPAMRMGTRIAFAKLGNDAGMLGALYFLLESIKAKA